MVDSANKTKEMTVTNLLGGGGEGDFLERERKLKNMEWDKGKLVGLGQFLYQPDKILQCALIISKIEIAYWWALQNYWVFEKIKILNTRPTMYSNTGTFNIPIYNTIFILPQEEFIMSLDLPYIHFITFRGIL